MREIIINGDRLSERGQAHDELAAAFGFPEYYGRNLDALADCLGEIGDETNVAVLGLGPFGEYGERVRQVLAECAKANESIKLSFPDEEALKLAKPFFECLDPPVLKSFPSKQRKQIAVLRLVARQFEPGRVYTEAQVNAILRGVHDDFATLRRELIDFGFLCRRADCSEYWKAP